MFLNSFKRTRFKILKKIRKDSPNVMQGLRFLTVFFSSLLQAICLTAFPETLFSNKGHNGLLQMLCWPRKISYTRVMNSAYLTPTLYILIFLIISLIMRSWFTVWLVQLSLAGYFQDCFSRIGLRQFLL